MKEDGGVGGIVVVWAKTICCLFILTPDFSNLRFQQRNKHPQTCKPFRKSLSLLLVAYAKLPTKSFIAILAPAIHIARIAFASSIQVVDASTSLFRYLCR